MLPDSIYLQFLLKRSLKPIAFLLTAFWVAWSFGGVKNFVYNRLYGAPTDEVVSVWDTPKIEDVEDTRPDAEVTFNGYLVRKTFRKHFSLWAMLVYHDDNTTFMKRHFWNAMHPKGIIYNQIASSDLFVAYGKTSDLSNLDKFKIGHELNLGYFETQDRTAYYNEEEVGNIHAIPANDNVKKGLSLLPEKKKVPIYLEGYLVDWRGTGEYDKLKIETALYPGQTSHQKAGGQRSILCYQLYLTKLIYDGYVFK